jgi:hypothetical protein
MAGYYSVCPCGSVDCPGWCGPEEPIDAELESLAETPAGLGWEPMDLWTELHEEEAKRKAEAAWRAHLDEKRRKAA